MQLIYERAENVNIWLGPAAPNSAMGMAVLEYLAHGANKDGMLAPVPDTLPPWQRQPPELVLAGLKDIMDRPWFERTWVVQEAVVSQRATMICGEDEFSWAPRNSNNILRFERMIKYAWVSPQVKQIGLDTIDMSPILKILDLQTVQHFNRNSTLRPAPDLLDMVYDLRHKSTTDPRDKIFALAGLSADGFGDQVEPDYNMTLEEVYLKLRRTI
jgi:hypothetical protein